MGWLPSGGRPGRMVAVAVALALVASACGSSDASETADAPSVNAPDSPSTAAVGGPSARLGAGVAGEGDADGDEGGAGDAGVEDDALTLAALEADWAERRVEVVSRLTAQGVGVDDAGVLRGPGGFVVDLGQCPAEWNNTAGIDDTSIRIAVTVPQSGDQATFNEIALGMKAYFDRVNSQGGVAGRMLQLVVRDDAYDPAFTVVAVDELAEAEQPLYITNVGSPGALAVQEDLNDRCIPQPFVASGHPALADPVNRPWSSGLQMSLSTEALMWAHWIELYLPDQVPVSVGALVIDNDFGQIYLDSFERWAAANSNIVSEVIAVRHDPASTTVTEQMAALAESAPDVLLSMTTGPACASAIDEAAKFGLDRSTMVRFTPSVCTQPVIHMLPAGAAADGVYAVGSGMRSITDEAHAEDPFVALANEELLRLGFDPSRHLLGVGFTQYGWAHVELLRIAAELPGGLSRATVLLAMRHLDLEHPMALRGVRFRSSGFDDAFFVEGAAFSRYDADARGWYDQGAAVDFDGTTPNCVWSQDRCQP